MMKSNWNRRMFLFIGIVVVSLLFIPRKVYLKPEQERYPAGVTTITATFRNILPNQYDTGHKFILEKSLPEGEWEQIARDERGAFFDDDGFSPVHGMKMTFDFTKYSDGLSEGIYRIRMTLRGRDGEEMDITCEFVVTE